MGTLTFSPSLYIGMAYFFFFFESTFRISVFLGFSEKMAILGVGRFKWILLPIVYFFFFGGGGGGGADGGLFNVKFIFFSIVFSAISNLFLKRLRFH